MFLFIDTGKFVNPTFYYFDTTLTVDVRGAISFTPGHFGSPGHFIFGVFYFAGSGSRATGAFLRFDLTLQTVQAQIQINSTTQKVQYTYLFFAENGCLSNYPYFTDSTKSFCVSQCSAS